MNPARIVRTLLTRRVIQKVTGKYGLVYFGRVDHNEDGVAIVRGHTVSPSQIDNHYSVGTIQGYDVTFVQRNSLVLMLDKTEQRCHWLIVSIKLKSSSMLPHVYVGPSGDDKMFQASYTQLKPLSLGNIMEYPHKFTDNYSVYGRPSDTLDVEWLLPPSSCTVIADYFSAMPFEVEDNTLYIYNENQHPTGAALDKMLENGVWLAKTIDALAGTKD
jgi:hypothetical protein